MLDQPKYVVKEHAKLLSSRKTYDILDAGGQVVAAAEQKTSTLAALLGAVLGPPATTIEVRAKADGELLFAVRRAGLVLKRVEAVDAAGAVVGRYKAKRFSLAGGYTVADGAGKTVLEVRGKLLKSEYQFFAADGTTVVGAVTKKWGGSAKALVTSADTYAVELTPASAAVPHAMTLALGAALAIDALFGAKAAGGPAAGGGGDE